VSLGGRLMSACVDHLPPSVIRAMARPYCAGATAADALREVVRLHQQGINATVSALGEAATTEAAAERHLDEVRSVLAELRAHPELDVRLGVKLTGLGLPVSHELAARNLARLVEDAEGRPIEVDMEQFAFVDDTLAIVRAQGDVGAVVQAYLPRTTADIEPLLEQRTPTRIVKGAYQEPNAWQQPEAVRENFVALVRRFLQAGVPVGIATHNEYVVVRALDLISQLGATAYEFQMIMGAGEALRARLLAAGQPVRVTVHFGEDLHLWSIRRLKENPEIARYAMHGLREMMAAR
jgi:proline dehydrogenase